MRSSSSSLTSLTLLSVIVFFDYDYSWCAWSSLPETFLSYKSNNEDAFVVLSVLLPQPLPVIRFWALISALDAVVAVIGRIICKPLSVTRTWLPLATRTRYCISLRSMTLTCKLITVPCALCNDYTARSSYKSINRMVEGNTSGSSGGIHSVTSIIRTNVPTVKSPCEAPFICWWALRRSSCCSTRRVR